MDAQSLFNTSNATTSGVMNAVSNFNSYSDALRGIADYNNAREALAAREQRNWSAGQADLTRSFNAAEAAKNRDWQERMSNTAHQREVSDLIAAGLNPVLSAMNGNGASVGSGSTASASNPSGSKAETDKTLMSALVSLLGNNLSAMTKLAEMSTSAVSNQAVADKYTSAQVLASKIAASASMYGSNLSSAASRYAANQHYLASAYSADQSRLASMYAADQHRDASEYVANRSYMASEDASYRSYEASLINGLRQLEGTRYTADKGQQNTWIRTVGGLVDTLLGGLVNSRKDVTKIIPYLLN